MGGASLYWVHWGTPQYNYDTVRIWAGVLVEFGALVLTVFPKVPGLRVESLPVGVNEMPQFSEKCA